MNKNRNSRDDDTSFDPVSKRDWEVYISSLPAASIPPGINPVYFKAVAKQVAFHADWTGLENMHASMQTVANETGIHRNTVSKVVSAMQDMGILVRRQEKRVYGKGKWTYVYDLYIKDAHIDVQPTSDDSKDAHLAPKDAHLEGKDAHLDVNNHTYNHISNHTYEELSVSAIAPTAYQEEYGVKENEALTSPDTSTLDAVAIAPLDCLSDVPLDGLCVECGESLEECEPGVWRCLNMNPRCKKFGIAQAGKVVPVHVYASTGFVTSAAVGRVAEKPYMTPMDRARQKAMA